jgi:type II secretory pathway pseudopilin PulG
MRSWLVVALVVLALFIGAAGGAAVTLTQNSQLNAIEQEAKDAHHAAEDAQREAEDAKRAAEGAHRNAEGAKTTTEGGH